MNPVQTGNFDYHDRKGSRALSWAILGITVLATVAVRLLFSNSILTIVVFLAVFILLAIATMPLEKKRYTHRASYELTSQKLTLHLAGKDLVLYRKEVYGVGCDPIMMRSGKDSEVVNYWKITIQTVAQQNRKKKKYELFSLNGDESKEDNQRSLQEFEDFGKMLKHWFVTTG